MKNNLDILEIKTENLSNEHISDEENRNIENKIEHIAVLIRKLLAQNISKQIQRIIMFLLEIV